MRPAEAVTALVGLGIMLNGLTLFSERRPRSLLWPELTTVVLAALPGLVLGATLLRALPAGSLQVLVGATVIAAAGAQLARLARDRATGVEERGRPPGGRSGPSAYAVGLVSGAITTSTNLNGPVLASWLASR
jgi:uncharacterized membrane protein YfcA